MPLKIIIIGAGIGGLTAAIGLKQAGHEVIVFEKSEFLTDVGAAIGVTPNGAVVLEKLGFSFDRAGAVDLHQWSTVDAVDLRVISVASPSSGTGKQGHPLRSLHRADYHNELLLLLARLEGSSKSKILRVGSAVRQVNASIGEITLINNEVHTADLIVAADGLHSKIRRELVRHEEELAFSGMNAFRFQLSTKQMNTDPSLREILDRKPPGVTIFADTTSTKERHLVWYDCRRGEIQNLVAVTAHHCATSDKPELLKQFNHLHPDITKILNAAKEDDIKLWPLSQRDPLSTWTFGKVVLVGDAAHPMFVFSGQGANQALEDAGALAYLLAGVDENTLPGRLKVFEQARVNRAARIQLLSSVRIGEEAKVADKVQKWADSLAIAPPMNMLEHQEHDWRFDIYARCHELLQSTF